MGLLNISWCSVGLIVNDCWHSEWVLCLQDGAHYMIYTPVDPLLFVAVKVCQLPFQPA